MSFPWAQPYEPKAPLMRYLDEKLPLPRFGYNAVGAGYPVQRPQVVVVEARIGGAADVPGGAVVGQDHAVALQRDGDHARLG